MYFVCEQFKANKQANNDYSLKFNKIKMTLVWISLDIPVDYYDGGFHKLIKVIKTCITKFQTILFKKYILIKIIL